MWPRFPQQLCKPYGHRTATSGPPNSTLKTLLPYHRIKIWPNHPFSVLQELKGGRENTQVPQQRLVWSSQMHIYSKTLRSALIHTIPNNILCSIIVSEMRSCSNIAHLIKSFLNLWNIPMFLTILLDWNVWDCDWMRWNIWPGWSKTRIGVGAAAIPVIYNHPSRSSEPSGFWLVLCKAWPE